MPKFKVYLEDQLPLPNNLTFANFFVNDGKRKWTEIVEANKFVTEEDGTLLFGVSDVDTYSYTSVTAYPAGRWMKVERIEEEDV